MDLLVRMGQFLVPHIKNLHRQYRYTAIVGYTIMVSHDFYKLQIPTNTVKKASMITELIQHINKSKISEKLYKKNCAHTTSRRSKLKLTSNIETKVKYVKINNYIQKNIVKFIYLTPLNYNLKYKYQGYLRVCTTQSTEFTVKCLGRNWYDTICRFLWNNDTTNVLPYIASRVLTLH